MCYDESSSDEDDFSIFVLGNVCRETISEIPYVDVLNKKYLEPS